MASKCVILLLAAFVAAGCGCANVRQQAVPEALPPQAEVAATVAGARLVQDGFAIIAFVPSAINTTKSAS